MLVPEERPRIEDGEQNRIPKTEYPNWQLRIASALLLFMIAPHSRIGLGQDPEEQVLFRGQVQVAPGKRFVKAFTTQSNFKNARIAGNVQANGGSGNDIRVIVAKGHAVVFDSGRRRSVVVSVDCSEEGQYTLIFDNSFSMVSPKLVSGSISLKHWGIDVEQNEADRQAALTHYRQATAVMHRLYTALKRDERVWGTAQLSAEPDIRLNNDSSINATADWTANRVNINKGLFGLTDKEGDKGEDVLAATLAHELGHIFYRHLGYGSTEQGAKGLFDELKGVTALDRIQEKEADVFGIRVACQAGFDPQGMLILMTVFAQMDSTAASFMKNHPSAVERYNYLAGEASKCQTLQTRQRPATTQSTGTPDQVREPGSLYAFINTSMGTITLKLFEKEAPLTVKNFAALAYGRKAWKDPRTGEMVTRPLYPGTIFHRVIPGFMIQGGDPLGNGSGDPGFTIPDELSQSLQFDIPGRLAMANTGAPHTSGSQFFITDAPTPHLNGKYTIFGQVIQGQEIVSSISHAPANAGHEPLTPTKIVSISVKREGPPSGASPRQVGTDRSCIAYEPASVLLTGTLVAHEGLRRWWGLQLDQPACMLPSETDPSATARSGITEMQLILKGGDFDKYRSLLQKRVTVAGALTPQVTAHHMTSVLIIVSSLRPIE